MCTCLCASKRERALARGYVLYVALYTNRKSEAITRYGTDKTGLARVSRRLFKAYIISRASADTAHLAAITAIFAIMRFVMGSRETERERERGGGDER